MRRGEPEALVPAMGPNFEFVDLSCLRIRIRSHGGEDGAALLGEGMHAGRNGKGTKTLAVATCLY